MKKTLAALALARSSIAAPAAFAAPSTDPAKMPAGTYVLDKTHASLTAKLKHMGLSNYTLRFTKLDFKGNHLYTWLVPKDMPDGYLEVHTFTVDPNGILYGGDNQYGRTQKFVPKPDADKKLLIGPPWRAK